MPIETSLFDYELPQELIAQTPLENRQESRLMKIDRETGIIEHLHFANIIDHLHPGDLLVINDTRVIPARLFVNKKTGARIELLFLKKEDSGENIWRALARPGRRIDTGTELFHDSSEAPFCTISAKHEKGEISVEVAPDDLISFLALHGTVPLPPYIKNKIDNPNRYQTVYAERDGSAAAPTAGLHFTPDLIEKIKSKGIRFATVTLHIGLDTFKPVDEEYIEDHKMHSEFYTMPDETAAAIAETKRSGGRVIAVGTTSVRAMESWALDKSPDELSGAPAGASGETRLFIFRREQFAVTNAVITNFHLPKSTLIILVSAFAGLDLLREAYEKAVKEKYRFYSFGDAMLIV